MKTEELTLTGYLFSLDAGDRSPLSDYYMKRICQGGGRAWALTEDGCILSYALLMNAQRGMSLSYLYTPEALRRRGYARALLHSLLSRCGGRLAVQTDREQPAFEAMQALLAGLGFSQGGISDLFTVPVTPVLWAHIDSAMPPRMKDYLLRDGSRCLPFSEMDGEIRRQLLVSGESAFGNRLEPAPLLTQSASGTDFDLSFVLVKNGLLRGYSLITRLAPDTVCIQQIAEAENELGRGGVIAPLRASFDAIRLQSGITRAIMTVNHRNARSARLVNAILEGTEYHVRENIAYFHDAQGLSRA